jgi:ComF family protein
VAYEGPAPKLVGAWKERGQWALTTELADLVVAVVPKPGATHVTFVPGDLERTLWRGTNTAEALARALGERWEIPVATLLARRRRAAKQRGLSRTERRRNVREAFEARTAPRKIAVVDDVYTTGATVSAAATALRRAGAREIEVITFARAVRR